VTEEEKRMNSSNRMTVPLGELVAAVFDSARMCSKDPQEVSRLATMTVMRFLLSCRERPAARRRST
jgi:hypothetical protein